MPNSGSIPSAAPLDSTVMHPAKMSPMVMPSWK